MKHLPYGLWLCADGREVLHNRFYQPILQRRPGGPIEPADPDEFVAGILSEWTFYGDATVDKGEAARRALRDWMSR